MRAEPPPRTVLEQAIRERRQTLEEFAEEAERYAYEHGIKATLSRRHLHRLASGRREGHEVGPVRPYTRKLLEAMLGRPIEELLSPPAALASPAAPPSPPEGLGLTSQAGRCMPAHLDAAYVENLRTRIRELIDLELKFGGDESSRVALRLFRSVHRKLGSSKIAPRIERDLYAAAGELGEVTGWLLYDADEHDLMRSVNNEALNLSRMAGDHSIELLTLQNMSMQAVKIDRPAEALRIAQMVLETRKLSPRLESLFTVREARALARLGNTTEAELAYEKAQSLYLDGIRDDDPQWAWWINDREQAWMKAMIQADAGDWSSATDTFQLAVGISPDGELRSDYVWLAHLLFSQASAGAWRDAAKTIQDVIPYVEEVGSARAGRLLLAAIDHLRATHSRDPLHELSHQLGALLGAAGYAPPKGVAISDFRSH